VFDGVRAIVLDLDSGPDGYRVGVEVAGVDNSGTPFNTDVAATDLTYSAVDDRGNPYLGQLDG
jgi:hypothetical protein